MTDTKDIRSRKLRTERKVYSDNKNLFSVSGTIKNHIITCNDKNGKEPSVAIISSNDNTKIDVTGDNNKLDINNNIITNNITLLIKLDGLFVNSKQKIMTLAEQMISAKLDDMEKKIMTLAEQMISAKLDDKRK